MDQDKLKILHELLETRRDELESVITDNEKILREQLNPSELGASTLDTNHPADMLSGDPDYEKELNLIRRERAELSLVMEALTRMELGTYGECEECETSIPFERLKAIPYTRFCIECKEVQDDAAMLGHGLAAPSSTDGGTVHL